MKCDCLAASIPEGSRLRKWSWISHFFCGFISMKQFLLSCLCIIHWTGLRPPDKSWVRVRSQVGRWGVSTNSNHYVCGPARKMFAGLDPTSDFQNFLVLVQFEVSGFSLFRVRLGPRFSDVFGPVRVFKFFAGPCRVRESVLVRYSLRIQFRIKPWLPSIRTVRESLRIFRYMCKQYDSDLN